MEHTNTGVVGSPDAFPVNAQTAGNLPCSRRGTRSRRVGRVTLYESGGPELITGWYSGEDSVCLNCVSTIHCEHVVKTRLYEHKQS